MKYLTSILLLLTVLLTGCGKEPQTPGNSDVPPAFKLETLAGEMLDFPTSQSDKVVAIRFWADWCQFCETEMNTIEPVYQKHKDNGFSILAINVSQERPQVEKFVQNNLNISYDVLLDTSGDITRAYNVKALPVTYFVGRDGLVKQKIIGEATADVFESLVKGLL